jgi:hypothetical protein
MSITCRYVNADGDFQTAQIYAGLIKKGMVSAVTMCRQPELIFTIPTFGNNTQPQPEPTSTGYDNATIRFIESTFHSIGIEWDIQGDANHDAWATIHYRKKGETQWNLAMDLFRIDYFGWRTDTTADRAYNMLAGSIFFLTPNTTYEIILKHYHPDNGIINVLREISTKKLPDSTGYRELHVIPPDGEKPDGDGSITTPFNGIEIAKDNAQPGDILQLHAGSYYKLQLDVEDSGTSDNYIVWQPYEDEEVEIDNVIGVYADYVWVRGFSFINCDALSGECPPAHELDLAGDVPKPYHSSKIQCKKLDLTELHGVVISHNYLYNYTNTLSVSNGRNCVIFNNTIIGDHESPDQNPAEEVDLTIISTSWNAGQLEYTVEIERGNDNIKTESADAEPTILLTANIVFTTGIDTETKTFGEGEIPVPGGTYTKIFSLAAEPDSEAITPLFYGGYWFDSEGIQVSGENHIIAYNSISHTSDSISTSGRNHDIYGNDIFDNTDDGPELDYSYANIRVWGNRIFDTGAYAFSFQPMYCGPWYFIKNLAYGRESKFKFHGMVSRFALINNTFIVRDPGGRPFISGSRAALNGGWGQFILNGFVKNNLFIYDSSSNYVWETQRWAESSASYVSQELVNTVSPTWRTDVDYNGYYYSVSPAFKWNDTIDYIYYNDLDAFSEGVGIDQNSIFTNKDGFTDYDSNDFTLKASSDAVGAAAVVNNVGESSDLGVYEEGATPPTYGARDNGYEIQSDEWTIY